MAAESTQHTVAAERLTGLGRIAMSVWVVVPLVGLLALVPRMLGLADFLTIDEPYHWIGRVRRFSAALAASDWAATNQTGHPGVTTMWLGALGRLLAEAQGLVDGGRAGNSVAFLAWLRLPLAMVNGLVVVVGFLLLRRLLRPQMALLAALLWALSPFLVAHSRLLHLDALLTSFMTLSVLAALLVDEGRGTRESGKPNADTRGLWSMVHRQWSLVLSAICGGLALLTKAPSLLLLPVVGLLLLLASPPLPLLRRVGWAVGRYLVWLVVALVVVVVCWPAMWVAPRAAVGAVINEVITNGGQPHHAGNFFMGQATGDPGWLFYPAVILWRNSPITLLGLLLLPLIVWRGGVAGRERRALLGLLLFVALFTLALSIEPKKFDRYLLPIWPALEVLAAVGLVRMLDVGCWMLDDRSFPIQHPTSNIQHPLLVSWLVLLLALQLAWYHPYYLAYFNPLLGGGGAAQRVLLVGWGEGMERVGAWLSERPDLGSGPVLSVIGPTLSPFVPGQVLDLQETFFATAPSYAVLYARSQQRDESAAAQERVRRLTPLWTLRMYGIEYAQVYQLPRPFEQSVAATFGDGLRLHGFSLTQEGDLLIVSPAWGVERDQQGGRFAFVHVVGPDGTRVAQADVPIDGGLFPQWQAGQQFGGAVPLQLPPNLPTGTYRIIIGVYDPASGARLPLTTGDSLPQNVAGPDAFLLQIVQR